VAYKLLYHPDVKAKDIPTINTGMRRRIRKALEERLMTEPEKYGIPLRKTLKGYRKLRVGDYRVVFKISGSSILVLAIIHRKKVYDKALKRS
jgi:mRNA interferase RelE/StbE